MHPDSPAADEFRLELIKKWIADAEVDFDVYDLTNNPVLLPFFTVLVAAANDRLETQRLAMLDPGEEME